MTAEWRVYYNCLSLLHEGLHKGVVTEYECQAMMLRAWLATMDNVKLTDPYV